MAESKVERQKAKSKGFATLGVPVGSTLTFRKDPAVTCKTVDDKNKVEYHGKVYPISGLAKELMNTQISGYHAFKYNGTLLAKMVIATTEMAPATPEPDDAAPVVTSAITPIIPQIVPLPRPHEATMQPQKANTHETPTDPLEGYPLKNETPPTEA
jgi:hypothetical protein